MEPANSQDKDYATPLQGETGAALRQYPAGAAPPQGGAGGGADREPQWGSLCCGPGSGLAAAFPIFFSTTLPFYKQRH